MTPAKEWIEEKIRDKYIRYFEYDEFSQLIEIGSAYDSTTLLRILRILIAMCHNIYAKISTL